MSLQSELVGLLTIKAEYFLHTDIVLADDKRLVVDSKLVMRADVQGDVFIFEYTDGSMWIIPTSKIIAIHYPNSK